MKKNNKRDTINLFFSAFLVTAYVVCSFFFSQLASTMNPNMSAVISVLIYSVFGLILFYATRVGDGKQILRFSPMTLIFLVLPTFYIILAYLIPSMPFGSEIAEYPMIMTVASVAFGYGLPYTFVSGYEIAAEEKAEEDKTDSEETVQESDKTEEIQTDEEAGADLENTEYFPEEEQEILAEQDMLDAENNSEEAAFCYYGEEVQQAEKEEDSENGGDSEKPDEENPEDKSEKVD